MTITTTAAASHTLTAAAFTIDRKALVEAMKPLSKVVERRNTIPICSAVLIVVDAAGIVTMTGTDLDLELTLSLDTAAATAPGIMMVDCHALKASLSKAKGTRVRLADAGGVVALTDTTSGTTTRLPMIAGNRAADWPAIKSIDRAGMTMPAADLRDDLSRAASCVSSDETRYYLNGVLFHRTAADGREVLRMAATDGHRLARITRPLPADIGDNLDRDAILPRKAVALVCAIIGAKPAGEACLAFTGTQFTFAYGNATMRGKLIDGTFPDYTRIIPQGRDRGFNIAGGLLADTLASVTAHCTSKTPCVAIGAATGWLTMAAHDVENGRAGTVLEAVEVLAPVNANGGTELAIGFNASYLRDMAAKVFAGADAIALRFEDGSAPAVIWSDDAPHVVGVLMPMRTDGGSLNPDEIRKLNRTPAEAFAEDFAARAAGAVTGGAALAAIEGTRAERRKARALAWTAARQLIASLRAYLAGSLDGRALRLAVKAAAARAIGDTAAAARADAEASHVANPGGGFSLAAIHAGLAAVGIVSDPLPAAAEHVVTAPKAVEVGEDAPAAANAPETAAAADPEPVAPVAANDDAPEDVPATLEAADIEAAAGMEAAGMPMAGEPECDAIWFQYVATAVGAAGPDRWAIETGRKQADRKARNRGKVLISGDTYAGLLDRFHAMFPSIQPAAASATVEEFEAACPFVEVEEACPSIALPSPAPETVEALPAPAPEPVAAAAADTVDTAALAATVAALAARLAGVEAHPALAPAGRPARTAAHLRAIRAYLRMRADRAAARADAAQARVNEAAVRASGQAMAREAMRLQEQSDAMRDDACAAEVQVIRLRGEVERLEQAIAAERRTAAADRVELQRLAPVVAALAALNPTIQPVTLAAAA